MLLGLLILMCVFFVLSVIRIVAEVKERMILKIIHEG